MTPLVSQQRARLAIEAWVLASVSVVSVLLAMTLVVSLWMLLVAGEAPFEPAGVYALLCAPGTLATALLCGRRCIRVHRDRADSRWACLGWGLVGGLLATVLIGVSSMVILVIWSGGPLPLESFATALLAACGVGLMAGGFAGTAVGLVFGAVMIAPIRLGSEHAWAHDSVERAAALCGRWLSIVAVLSSSVLLLEVVLVPGDAPSAIAMMAAWCVVTAVGLAAYTWGAARLDLRARWLDRVRAGEEPGWAVIELDDEAARVDLELRPFRGSEAASARHVLARLEPAAAGACRAAEHPVPVALLAAR